MKAILTIITLFFFTSSFSQANKLKGAWDNGNGQIFVFKKGGKALWIFYSENQRDTFHITYQSNFSSKPFQLDLSNFTSGPLKGKTLFGIVEFLGKSTIRFDCEAGTNESIRPKEFNPKDTQTYKRKNRI